MKFAPLLLAAALAPPAHADLVARVATDQGDIDVVLDYETAPLAVANFITLSQGTRARIDPATGNLTNAPLYVGEKFFRIVDTENFEIAQTGSGAPSNSGGPGYTFPDEFDPDVRHTPYVLSMANSGPNSNGSQIFFTGDLDLPTLDDVHTVFGAVADPAGRATIDAILAAGDNGSEITTVTIERTDAAAEAFDEFAQGLPEIAPAVGRLETDGETAVDFVFSDPQSAGTVVAIYGTTDFETWTPLNNAIAGPDNAPARRLTIDAFTESEAFYRLHRILYDDSPTPASLANRTLETDVPGAEIDFQFDDTGEGGTSIFTSEPEPGAPPEEPVEGAIQSVSYNPDGYGARIIIQSDGLLPLNFQIGFDSDDATGVSGRHSLSVFRDGQWQPAGKGTATLGEPDEPAT